ncbi:MAG: nuclear transport factor 2 family protein [Phycisphaerales bacterium]
MTVNESDRKIVDNLFKAMQAGPAGEDDMMALFADDAVFVEPFSGEPKTHTGKDAIRASFQDMWREPTPDMKLILDRVDLDGQSVRAEWTCTSTIFATPMRGYDVFTIANGKITRLEITVTDMPPMGE